MPRFSTKGLKVLAFALVLALALFSASQILLTLLQNQPEHKIIESGKWPYVGQNQQNTWYSPQTRINPSNIGALTPLWFVPLEETAGTPVISNGLVYVAGGGYAPLPASIEALNESTGAITWIDGPGRLVNLSFSTNAGVTVDRGNVFATTLDGKLVSLNSLTGQLNWQVSFLEGVVGSNFPTDNEPQATPLVFNNRVVMAMTGGDNGSRGFLRSFDEDNGRLLWTFYTVPPDPINATNQAFYKNTWGPCATCSGGDVWSVPAVDPQTGIIYFGTGNPYPSFDASQRSTNANETNLYTNSVIALNSTSGEMIWFYQAVANDVHDWDMGIPVQLFNTTINGRATEVVGAGGKNGYYYALDAKQGNLLYKVKVGIHENENVSATRQGHAVYPGSFGGIDTYSSYNPQTNMIYTVAYNKPNNYTLTEYGIDFTNVNNVQANSTLYAINASTGIIVWTLNLQDWSGGVSTSNSLAFTSAGNGTFYALDAWTGKVLWNYRAEVQPKHFLWNWGPPSVADGKMFATMLTSKGGVLCFSIRSSSPHTESMILGLSVGFPQAYGLQVQTTVHFWLIKIRFV